jgi:chromosome segregation ATPase
MTLAEFDQRLEESNTRLRQELAEAQARVQRLQALIARKESFAQRLAQALAEIEREENEIAALEKGLRAPRSTTRRRPPAPQARQ